MSNRSVFWSIWLVALVPVILAILMWVTGIGIPDGRVNKGELVDPALPLVQWGGDPEQHTGHWSLLLVPQGICDSVCEEELEALKRVHDALGRESDRVRVMPAAELEIGAGIWVIDPLGNLVLRHPLSFEGKALLGDMKRLLKASRLG